jgi:hypothetical protein
MKIYPMNRHPSAMPFRVEFAENKLRVVYAGQIQRVAQYFCSTKNNED